MTVSNGTIEIQSGITLQEAGDLDAAAEQVSQWLAEGVPNTKPKSADTLLVEADASLYAMNGGNIVGHVALLQYPELSDPPALLAGQAPEGAKLLHFGIGSLVVARTARGGGIGRRLLSAACDMIAERANAGPQVALVTAVAAPTSLPLFEAYGFHSQVGPGYGLLYDRMDYSLDSPKTFVGRVF